MSFLPRNYEIPVDSNYLKLEKGDTRFRILDSAIVGTEYWTEIEGQNKPVRVRPGEVIPMEKVVVSPFTGKLNMNHFWMFPVWNYKAKKIQILEVTQKTIMQAINALIDNPKWGDPTGYDLTITRTEEGKQVKYAVMPDPKESIPTEAKTQLKSLGLNMEAIFDGRDPFQKTEDKPEEVKPEEKKEEPAPVKHPEDEHKEDVSPDEIPF